MRLVIACFGLFLGLSAVGCSLKDSAEAQSMVFAYSDFGPQMIACELLGMEYYEWDPPMEDDPYHKYNIKVVVYEHVTLDEVRRAFPTVKGKVDYRYVERRRAITHVKAKIAELDQWGGDELKPVRDQLVRTLQDLESKFGR